TRIWLRPLDGTTARRLDGTERAYGVFWSPDGRYLAFPTPGKLKRIEVATGAVKELCPAVDVRGITWNGQGVIVFGQIAGVGLLQVSADGGESRPVTFRNQAGGEEQQIWPQFLPDGRHILYQVRSAKLELSGTYVASLDSKPESQHPVQVLANLRSAEYVPAIRGDGGFLLYVRDRTLFAQRFDPDRFHLEGDRLAIAEDVGHAAVAFSGFAVSPSGALAYSTVDGDSFQLHLVARDGSTLRAIGESDRYVSFSLSHDERQVALWKFDAAVGTYDIWLM